MPSHGGVVAVDHGSAKTGFAACDALRLTTRALAPLRSAGDSDALLKHIEDILEERGASTLLVGLPRKASGDEGERAAPTRVFAQRLAARQPLVSVVLYDESLTTKAAEWRMRDADVPKDERREWRDSYAALVLLEDWLEGGASDGEVVPAEVRP